jgi:hypothetical protein
MNKGIGRVARPTAAHLHHYRVVVKRSIGAAADIATAVVLLSGCTDMAKCRNTEDDDCPAVERL